MTLTSRDLELIRANATKSVAEINEKAIAETAQIEAVADLKNQVIRAETLITKTVEETKGKCEAQMVEIRADKTSKKLIAAKELEVAATKAETIKIVGEAEYAIANVMQSRRKYEYLNKKLEVIESMKETENLHVMGENNSDSITQIAAYRISTRGGSLIDTNK